MVASSVSVLLLKFHTPLSRFPSPCKRQRTPRIAWYRCLGWHRQCDGMAPFWADRHLAQEPPLFSCAGYEAAAAAWVQRRLQKLEVLLRPALRGDFLPAARRGSPLAKRSVT